MTTIVLTGSEAYGVVKTDMIDFLAANPDADFVQACNFLGELPHIADGEVVHAAFDTFVHADMLAEIEAEYGIYE